MGLIKYFADFVICLNQLELNQIWMIFASKTESNLDWSYFWFLEVCHFFMQI